MNQVEEIGDPKKAKSKKYRTIFIIALCASIFIVGGALAANYFINKKSPASAIKKTTTAKKETLTLCLLDGKSYKSDLATRHPLAISIENHPDARPQYGLSSASIVYEAITEGGITRFLAIYGPENTSKIGPIRSARLFFMDWVKEYDAFFAHAGGNEDALANIDPYSIKDIPHSNTYYWRDNAKGVASEHTLFSSTDKLYQYAQSKKYDISTSNFDALKFKADGPASPEEKSYKINFSSATYKVSWKYDPAKNIYIRSLAGKEDVDKENGKAITVNNVIIQTVSRTLQPHGSYGSENWVFKTTGTGSTVILRDGKAIKGTWKKDNLNSRTKFYDEAGMEIQFNPGHTWYEIVPPEVNVTI